MIKRIKDFLYSKRFDNLMLTFATLYLTLLFVLLVVFSWILFTIIF